MEAIISPPRWPSVRTAPSRDGIGVRDEAQYEEHFDLLLPSKSAGCGSSASDDA